MIIIIKLNFKHMRETLKKNIDNIIKQEDIKLAAIFSDLAEKIKPKAQDLAKKSKIPFSDAFVKTFKDYLSENFLADIETLKKQKNLSTSGATTTIVERHGHLLIMAKKQGAEYKMAEKQMLDEKQSTS